MNLMLHFRLRRNIIGQTDVRYTCLASTKEKERFVLLVSKRLTARDGFGVKEKKKTCKRCCCACVCTVPTNWLGRVP